MVTWPAVMRRALADSVNGAVATRRRPFGSAGESRWDMGSATPWTSKAARASHPDLPPL